MSNPTPIASNDNSLLGHIFQNSESEKIRRAFTAYAVGATAWATFKKLKSKADTRFAYSVSIPNSDEIYNEVQERLLSMIPVNDRRALIVRGVRGKKFLSASSDSMPEVSDPMGRKAGKTRLAAFYDGDSEQRIVIEGHRVKVSVNKEEVRSVGGKEEGYRYQRPEKIVFTTSSLSGRAAVIRFLEEIVESLNPPEGARLYITSRWGSWERRKDIEPRDLSSIVLREGQKEALIDDMRRFLGQKDDYSRLGLPFHRGFLLHGPPGTGKSSLAQALAHELGLDVYYCALKDIEKDTSLLQLISSVEPGSLLLLEDIDVLHAATSRDGDPDFGISMSGLLNALDGIGTPNGLITVMTTNHPEVLDPALIRPGRIDYTEEISYMDDPQLRELFTVFDGYDVRFPTIKGLDLSPADVIDFVKKHIGDPEEVEKQIRKLIKKRRAKSPLI